MAYVVQEAKKTSPVLPDGACRKQLQEWWPPLKGTPAIEYVGGYEGHTQ